VNAIHKSPLRNRGPKAVRMDPNRILDAAQEVFSQDGIKAASLRAIAQRAGCDPALIYYHFESKEAMFAALLDRSMPQLADALMELAKPEDTRHSALRIQDVLRVYRELMSCHVGMRAIVRGEMVRGAEGIQDMLAARVRANMESVWAILRQGIERGEIRADLDLTLAPFFLIKLYLEIFDVLPIMAPRITGTTAEEVIPRAERAWLELYWRGIAADPSKPMPLLSQN
jgi:AcrR family transcriptional regulator